MFITVLEVLKLISLFPIFDMPSSPISSDTTRVASYCVLLLLLFDICASNNIGSISCPEVTPYIYHTIVVLPSSFSVTADSAYFSPPLVLLPAIYVKPSGNVTSAFNVTFSICEVRFAFPFNCGSTLYVTVFSFLPKS